MWKIFAGVVAVLVLALFIFMHTGDRVEGTHEFTPAAITSSPVTPTAEPTKASAPPEWAHRAPPTPEAAAASAVAASEASATANKPSQTKMSTTGTIVVIEKGHKPKQ